MPRGLQGAAAPVGGAAAGEPGPAGAGPRAVGNVGVRQALGWALWRRRCRGPPPIHCCARTRARRGRRKGLWRRARAQSAAPCGGRQWAQRVGAHANGQAPPRGASGAPLGGPRAAAAARPRGWRRPVGKWAARQRPPGPPAGAGGVFSARGACTGRAEQPRARAAPRVCAAGALVWHGAAAGAARAGAGRRARGAVVVCSLTLLASCWRAGAGAHPNTHHFAAAQHRWVACGTAPACAAHAAAARRESVPPP